MGGGILDHLSNAAKHWLDTLSLGAIAATFLGWLPHIAAGLSLVWVILRIGNELIDRKTKRLEHKVMQQEYELNSRRLGNE